MTFILFTLTIFASISFKSADSQAIRCAYSDTWFTVEDKNIKNAYYSCDLKTQNSNFREEVVRIGGQHIPGRSDNDVKYLLISNGNLLRQLTPLFCQKFRNLEVISIKNAQLESAHENSLSLCENLKFLEIDGSNLRQLPDYLLIRNTKLRFIWLKSSQLSTLPENFFLNQKDLVFLDMERNQFYQLPKNVFNSLTKLHDLNLGFNKLQSIDPTWLAKLQDLRRLALNDNLLTEIPPKRFKFLKNLQRLWLNNNQIKSLTPHSFDGLQSLMTLSLHNNQIQFLPRNVFIPLKNLHDLDLSRNNLRMIHSDSFGGNGQLKKISLQENRINGLDERLFDTTAVLQINLVNNVCGNTFAKNRNEIKSKLANCFRNYKPRMQQQGQQLPESQETYQPQNNYQPQINYQPPNNYPPQANQGQQFSHRPQNPFLPHRVDVISCGKPQAAHGNIIGGTQISKGAFPWITALVYTNGKFFCGGTLISSTKVISAAHCIQEKGSKVSLQARNAFVLLGVHDLRNSIEPGRLSSAIRQIQKHPDWNSFTESFDADISVIILDQPVVFSPYIQPVCLVINTAASYIPTGIVVGFGKSEDGTKLHENIPRFIQTPIHSNQECFRVNEDLGKISSGRTFCGGQGRGVGVCQGDSGSGLFVVHDGAYYLRGVVSSSLYNGHLGCDVENYSVFTDVLKFYDWIMRIN